MNRIVSTCSAVTPAVSSMWRTVLSVLVTSLAMAPSKSSRVISNWVSGAMRCRSTQVFSSSDSAILAASTWMASQWPARSLIRRIRRSSFSVSAASR
ncbi:hypothetical protein D3C85_1265330 [compost metagenome]